jgi:lysophospholipid acyltransferase (LPLAT)-like uncharacterized protein
VTPWKKFLRSDILRRVLCWLAAGYLRFAHATSRWTIVGGDVPDRLLRDGRSFIVAFWHNRLLMMPYAWMRPVPFRMLISQHRDGQLIARTVAYFGIDTIAGSTSRGGVGALRALVKALREGACVGITPDGPRGPRMRASDGIVNIARLAGAPVLPATYAVSRRRVLDTWDRLLVPLPFAHGVIAWSEPIEMPRDLDDAGVAAMRRRIEDALIAVTAEADRRCGQAAIEPAPPVEEARP